MIKADPRRRRRGDGRPGRRGGARVPADAEVRRDADRPADAEVDGFELLKQTENLPTSHRPGRIIAISGEYEAGALHGRAAVQFLPKPFNIDTC
jgi:hypothetical protein